MRYKIKEYTCIQVRPEYKIAHYYKVLERQVLICALKLFTLEIAQRSFGREFQSLGAATIKALNHLTSSIEQLAWKVKYCLKI